MNFPLSSLIISASQFAADSPLEGGVCCEPVSEVKFRSLEKLNPDFDGFMGSFRDRKTLLPRSHSPGIYLFA